MDEQEKLERATEEIEKILREQNMDVSTTIAMLLSMGIEIASVAGITRENLTKTYESLCNAMYSPKLKELFTKKAKP